MYQARPPPQAAGSIREQNLCRSVKSSFGFRAHFGKLINKANYLNPLLPKHIAQPLHKKAMIAFIVLLQHSQGLGHVAVA
jgi:hypothetical protein